MYVTSLLSSLALFWMLLSGHTDSLLLSLGAISCLFTAWLCRRMDIVDHESHPHQIGPFMPRYWALLTLETLKSNWQTALAVLMPGRVAPVTAYIATPLQQDVVNATLANSITLTPGTLTLDVQKDRMRIHALSAEFMDDLRQGGMIERAKKLDDAC
ncbi:MAG: Na+/H+ antiporter subunit E [Oceanococcus sp.]